MIGERLGRRVTTTIKTIGPIEISAVSSDLFQRARGARALSQYFYRIHNETTLMAIDSATGDIVSFRPDGIVRNNDEPRRHVTAVDADGWMI